MFRTLAVAAAAFALSAGAASATIVIVAGNIPGNPDENVLLNTGLTGNPIFGTTNQTGAQVRFGSNENLTAPSNGQARVEAVDGGYTLLNFGLVDPNGTFGRAEFNVNAAAAGNITITALDQLGNSFSNTFALSGNGQNFFNLTTLNGERIRSISYTTTAQVADTRQIRLGGVTVGAAVPEPATWAMMILGFGMVGAGLRLRRKPLLREQT